MATQPVSHQRKRFTLTQDTWAVILALVLAVAVHLGLFKVPW
jgi:hypothetical protein